MISINASISLQMIVAILGTWDLGVHRLFETEFFKFSSVFLFIDMQSWFSFDYNSDYMSNVPSNNVDNPWE